jgi:hypothetical protein
MEHKDSDMSDSKIIRLFQDLYIDDIAWLVENKPLLAHYTSISTLEKILKTDELWLSNPLFMNDLEEVRFGISQGVTLFEQSGIIEGSCGSSERINHIRSAFHYYLNEFDTKHVFDTYVFCLTRHEPANTDGLLSMWRAYGGQGNGAALIFNTSLITAVNPESPLLIAKVRYAPSDARVSFLSEKLREWCGIVKFNSIPDDKLYVAAFQLFNLLKVYALTSKHNGFSEEEEWRIIYMPDRDTRGILKSGFHYVIGDRGVEPKLKLRITPLPVVPAESWTFDEILDHIILGPSVSSPLAVTSVCRMLETIGKGHFQRKVIPSTIPLRPV